MYKNGISLLDFGRRFSSPQGSSYYLGDNGLPLTERPKETWITSRMAHVYSIGKILGIEGSETLASQAIGGLMGELKDHRYGGFYSGITMTGQTLPDKMCYAHAFVILAASSALLADINGAKDLLYDALDIFDRYFWDEDQGLTYDTWDIAFTSRDDYRGLNANMHTVEAFLAVADATGDEIYRKRAGRIIDRVINWAKEHDYRLPEHFDSDWNAQPDLNWDNPDDPFKPFGATPGHGMEWARLILQYAKSSFGSGAQFDEYIEVSKALYDRARIDAWNADGAKGFVYTTDFEGNPVIHDRMHWTLAEAINTSSVLYRITKDERYANDYSEYLEYLDQSVMDHRYGSWFHQLDEKNSVIDTVWPGKPDIYHAFQAMFIPYVDTGVSLASAILNR
jgi:mannose/cellobiose epimerase-like protein (N-acyl-D-glucosamine 2-epimerase family)